MTHDDALLTSSLRHPSPLSNHPQVVTVDKYQGQQSDYVILSLVRSKTVGHLRDVRRLVVALSRARLGLYIVGRADLFANCNELRPAFEQLMRGPRELRLVRNEAWAEDWPEKEGVRMQVRGETSAMRVRIVPGGERWGGRVGAGRV